MPVRARLRVEPLLRELEREEFEREEFEREEADREEFEREDPERAEVERERLPEAPPRLLVRDPDRLLLERLVLVLVRERRRVARWSRGMSARTTSLTRRPISARRNLAMRSSSRRMLRAS